MTFHGTPTIIAQSFSGDVDGAHIHEEWQVAYSDGYNAGICAKAGFGFGTPSGLPVYGNIFVDTDIRSYINHVECNKTDDSDPHNDGIVIFKYDYIPFPAAGYDPNPLSRPADIRWGGSDLTEVKFYDFDGNKYVNSANQLYSNLPSQYVLAGECTVSFNVADNPGNNCVLYSYSTNASGIWGVSTGFGLMGKWEGQLSFENNVTFWRVTVPMRFRGDGLKWRYYAIDSGYVDEDGNVIGDDVGQQHSTPVLLDGSGGKLTPGDDPVIFPTDGFKQYNETDWSASGVVNPFA